MKIVVDGLARLPRKELTSAQLCLMKRRLTIAHVGKRKNAVLVKAYQESEEEISIPRAYFHQSALGDHEVIDKTYDGSGFWRGDLELADDAGGAGGASGFREAMVHFVSHGRREGVVAIESSTDAARLCCGLIRSFKMCTLILCPDQSRVVRWKELVEKFLPDANVCVDFRGWSGNDHVVVTTASRWMFGSETRGEQFGFAVIDQYDRIDVEFLSGLLEMLYCSRRLGISSEPVQVKGLNRLYSYHLGRPIFSFKGRRMTPKIRRVWSKWRSSGSGYANPAFMSQAAAVDRMCKSKTYVGHVVEQILLALKAGRKVLVFSGRILHLKDMRSEVESQFSGRELYTDLLVPGVTDEEMVRALGADVLFSPYDFLDSLPDTSSMDTVVLSTPVRDPAEYISCILEPKDGKKDPVVVDMRCDSIPVCKKLGYFRDRTYKDLYGDKR